MRRAQLNCGLWVCCVFLLSTGLFANTLQQNLAEQELLIYGKKAYERRCSGCHGLKGDGQGPAASFLDPRPRDFTSGVFKFTSTPLGILPTDHDLMKVISQGVLGTSMPSFPLVPEVERFAMVQYIKSFSPAWKDSANYGSEVTGVAFPREDFLDHSSFISRATKGKKLFAESCVTCHGLKGVGDGEGAADLEDDWGQTIRPANLRDAFIKSGKSVKDIYRVLLSGIGGTPMPSFKGVYSDDQLWDLAAYVLYLRGEEAGIYEGMEKPITEIKSSDL